MPTLGWDGGRLPFRKPFLLPLTKTPHAAELTSRLTTISDECG